MEAVGRSSCLGVITGSDKVTDVCVRIHVIHYITLHYRHLANAPIQSEALVRSQSDCSVMRKGIPCCGNGHPCGIAKRRQAQRAVRSGAFLVPCGSPILA